MAPDADLVKDVGIAVLGLGVLIFANNSAVSFVAWCLVTYAVAHTVLTLKLHKSIK